MDLLNLVGQPWHSKWHDAARTAFEEALGGGNGQYPVAAKNAFQIRAPELQLADAPFAALIHPNNQSSGGYGGMSLVLFPSETGSALVAMVVGTLGLAEDAAMLGRPGHARRLAALTKWLNSSFGQGQQIAWAKSDPSNIESDLPEHIKRSLADFQPAVRKYGRVTYAFAVPPARDSEALRSIVWGFLDIAMEERAIAPLAAHKQTTEAIRRAYLNGTMADLSAQEVRDLLASRRYVIVEGPPGTGKTRLAHQVLRDEYQGKGTTVQFHPGTTYENFVGGLAPVTGTDDDMGLRFEPRPGYLIDAVDEARRFAPEPYLLHLDEINRADLARILGEAIYLFEPMDTGRVVQLPYTFPRKDGSKSSTISIPENLHVLGTMNSSDRSIAILDVAIRRRFAFVRLWPQRAVVEQLSPDIMVQAFDRLADTFLDWASDDAFALLPGHSYFLEPDAGKAPASLRQNLVPLLEEYLAQGYLPGFAEPVRAYIQWIESL